jgi:hypothetical protein
VINKNMRGKQIKKGKKKVREKIKTTCRITVKRS